MKLTSGVFEKLQDQLKSKFSTQPLSVNFHGRLRLASFPFKALINMLPIKGFYLDVGCGFGILLFFLASLSSKRILCGYDPAITKTEIATQLLSDFFYVKISRKLPGAKFNVITVVDVLYLLKEQDRQRLLIKLFYLLKHRGKIYVSFVPKEPSWRYVLAWLQEWLMVRGVKKTQATSAMDFETEGWMRNAFRESGFVRVKRRILPALWPFWHKHVVFSATRA